MYRVQIHRLLSLDKIDVIKQVLELYRYKINRITRIKLHIRKIRVLLYLDIMLYKSCKWLPTFRR